MRMLDGGAIADVVADLVDIGVEASWQLVGRAIEHVSGLALDGIGSTSHGLACPTDAPHLLSYFALPLSELAPQLGILDAPSARKLELSIRRVAGRHISASPKPRCVTRLQAL